ncbi:hypothetical protein AWC38_SpisGene5940 [Stylophora pistillata]|uniref:THAP-type domain-containing protein n=1 Tax=Stylophora pistillata TaxID=50429 RepID=A0A2B4SLA0_STYPI|nr:hypothetical protein AWC38_SpisGene5940 [Stylophora pistillata]
MLRTAEETTTATIELPVVGDAVPVVGPTPLPTERLNQRRMINRRGDPAEDDVPDIGAGLMRNALRAISKKNEMVIMKEEKREKSVRHRILAVIVLTADSIGTLVERTEREESGRWEELKDCLIRTVVLKTKKGLLRRPEQRLPRLEASRTQFGRVTPGMMSMKLLLRKFVESPQVSTVEFPVVAEIRVASENTKRRRPKFKISTASRVCSRHFIDEDYLAPDKAGRRLLKRGAVPLKFDWTSEPKVRRKIIRHTDGDMQADESESESEINKTPIMDTQKKEIQAL